MRDPIADGDGLIGAPARRRHLNFFGSGPLRREIGQYHARITEI